MTNLQGYLRSWVQSPNKDWKHFPEAKAEDLASETKANVKDLTLEAKAKDTISAKYNNYY